MEQQVAWTKRSVKKEYFKYVSLNILSMIGVSYYIIVDTYFIGNGVGALGLTALNFAIPVFGVQQALGFLFSVGIGTKYAILKAQKNDDEANYIFSNGIISVAIVGVLFALLVFGFSRPIAIWMGARGDMIELSAEYTRTVLMFTPFFLLSSTMNNLVKNDYNPRLSMIAMISGSISNVILDYIFIYPMNLGMFGAALATGIAPIVNLSIISIHIMTKRNGFSFVKVKYSIKRIWSIMKLGITAAVTELAAGIVVMIFNRTILSISGNIGVAAYGVIANLAIVVMAIFNGIAQGIQPMISTSYGMKDTAKMKLVLRYACISAVGASAVMYGLLYVYASPVVELFNGEHLQSLHKIAVEGVRIYFTGILFCGVSIVIAMYFNSRESVKEAFFIAVLRGGLVIAPVLGILVYVLRFEMKGVWLSFPISELVILWTVLYLYFRSKKTYN